MSPGTQGERRYFWGNTLKQALTQAARHFQIAPEDLAYRVVEKRHGFVKQPRRLILEVNPESPRRTGAATPTPRAPSEAAAAPVPQRSAAPSPSVRIPASAPRPERAAEPRSARPSPARRHAPADPLDAPDEEAALAASVAMARLLRFAGLDLEIQVDRQPDRLDLRLSGAEESRLRELGAPFLEHLGQLLPRLVKSLSGKQVLCRIDGAGIRSAREEELRGLALAAAQRVLESGEPELLDPLPAGDRRIVHLALADDTRLATESQGSGLEKRLRISRARETSSPQG